MKLIVVEDEKIIRTGLLKHVPWQRLGVSKAGNRNKCTGTAPFGKQWINSGTGEKEISTWSSLFNL